MDVTIPCPCPPKADGTARHESDTVTLREPLSFRERLSLRQTIKWAKEVTPDISDGELLAVLTEAYCLQGISAWTLVDEKGRKVDPSRVAIRDFLEAHDEQAMAVADAADGLYSEVVLLPLLLGASKSSGTSQIDVSTSPRNGGPTPRKHSKRSSTTTMPTVVTGPMLVSPAGGSN